ncbi:hypothetical protein EYZ11_013348 [Aspergillus tanneri]|uniref:Uncharacterized protein n=1 Tax=Aspergillus tanneri TaxID=1220188 RepID=A0A4V3UMG2_9EURO|nr:hypothetical protein EYZ11_013348 [Aspergillus tanneri]
MVDVWFSRGVLAENRDEAQAAIRDITFKCVVGVKFSTLVVTFRELNLSNDMHPMRLANQIHRAPVKP